MRAALAVAVALLVAGCSTAGATGSSNSLSATGHQLYIYISDPQDVSSDASLQDVVYAAQLAFSQNPPGTISGYGIHLKTARGAKPSDNARTAIQDTSSIAYIGEIKPGDSTQTIGITEALDLLQLSPTEPNGIANSEYELLGTYGRTFAHLAPKSASVPAGFKALFAKDYGHRPSADAAYGYQAMTVLLQALHSLGSKVNDRASVVKAVRKLTK